MQIALSRSGMEEHNLDLGAAPSSAINDWPLACSVKKEPRLRAARRATAGTCSGHTPVMTMTESAGVMLKLQA